MFRTAYRITGNAADAEDVLQTIFLRLLRRDAKNSDSIQDPETYLRRSAINTALDVIRSRQSEQTVPLLEDGLGLPRTAPAQDRDYDLRRALAGAIARLEPRSAEIFAFRFLEGFSNRQIAEMLGISQVLVAVIVHRTRRQLQNELRPYLSVRTWQSD